MLLCLPNLGVINQTQSVTHVLLSFSDVQLLKGSFLEHVEVHLTYDQMLIIFMDYSTKELINCAASFAQCI